MKGMKTELGSLVCLLMGGLGWAQQEAAVLPKAGSVHLNSSVEELVRYVVPSDEELAWLDLGWKTSLASGLEAGAREGKPVLLWAMNGHPLAST